jgi:outer membrane immunogenic protein
MKKATLTSLVIFTLCGLVYAGPEAFSGKDMKQVVPVPEPCPIDWTGFYVGGHVGYGFTDFATDFIPLPTAAQFFNLQPTTLNTDAEGFFGGIQVGYNHKFGAFVVGVEADGSWSDISGDRDSRPIIQNNGTVFAGTNPHLETHQDVNWFGSFRGRIGFTPVCRMLLYATGGLAVADVDYAADTEFRPTGTVHYPASFSETQLGWTAGAGAEFAFNKRWSVKVEYLYYGFQDDTSVVANPVGPLPPFQIRYNWETSFYTVDAGVNFHF